MNKRLRAIKDYFVFHLYGFILKRLPKLRTPMMELVATLKVTGLWPRDAKALEIFGMHGLWHTADYLKEIRSLDFCEIDPFYLERARRWLPQKDITFHLGDSAQSLKNLPNRAYELVVLDMPFHESFTAEQPYRKWVDIALPKVKPGGLLIVNVVNERFERCTEIAREAIKGAGLTGSRELTISRNEIVSYNVWHIDGSLLEKIAGLSHQD